MADLAALLDKEASAEIEAILSEARARASEIVAKAREEAEVLLAARERSAKGQHDAALVRAQSAAQLEASSLKLRAQHQAVEEVFSDVRSKIDALTRDGSYAAVLETLIREALAGSGGNADDIRAVLVNPADAAAAKRAASSLGIDATVETDPAVAGGVRLRTGASNVVIENTLYGRLEALESDVASDVSRVLLSKGA